MGGIIEFAYDVVCPYAYLASKQVEETAARCGAKLVWTPVLLGGLYEASKAPQVFAWSTLQGYRHACGTHQVHASCKSCAYAVLPLRVAVYDEKVIKTIYHAAWIEDKEIAKPTILLEALSLGCCGAPTFQILDPDGQQVALIWGQDRLNVVADILCGWHPKGQVPKFGQKERVEVVNATQISKL